MNDKIMKWLLNIDVNYYWLSNLKGFFLLIGLKKE